MPPPGQRYEEFKLRLDSNAPGTYHVHASTRDGDASASFDPPFSALELENFVLRASRSRGRRRIDASALGEAKRFGGALFKSLFHDDVNNLYHDALSTARSSGGGLRITLCLSGAPDLMDVPWEYLFDDPDFLAASAFTPVVRYLDLPRGHRPLRVAPPLRILGVVSSPDDYERLDVERERSNLERALSSISEAGAVELAWLERPTLGALLRRLQKDTFHVLHYVGHGGYDEASEEGVLVFEDDSGRANPISGDKLGMILHDITSLRLAVLNACEGARTSRTDPFAGVAQSLVQRDIPAVIAMQFEISDEAAITFAEGFYDAVASGCPADTSLAAARLAMLADHDDDIEWGTPVLFMRVPDGRLFEVGKRRISERATTRVLPGRAHPPGGAEQRSADGGGGGGGGASGSTAITLPASRGNGAAGPEDSGSAGGGEDRMGPRVRYRAGWRPRLRWLLALPAAVVLAAVALILAGGGSSSDADVVQAWMRSFDSRDINRAASYWTTPALWTSLLGNRQSFGSIDELKVWLNKHATCHKVVDTVVVDPKRSVVRLRVSIDGELPNLPSSRHCTSINHFWYEYYQLRGERIVAAQVRYAPPSGSLGGAAPAPSPTSTGTIGSSRTPGPGGGTTTSPGASTAPPPGSSGSPPAGSSGSPPEQSPTVSQTSTAATQTSTTVTESLQPPPTP